DTVSENAKVDRQDGLQQDRQCRDRRHEQTDPSGDRDRHRSDPHRGAHDMRQRPPEPERRAGGPEQDIVRPGRAGTDEGEPDEPDEPWHTPTLRSRGLVVLYDPAMEAAGVDVRAWRAPGRRAPRGRPA